MPSTDEILVLDTLARRAARGMRASGGLWETDDLAQEGMLWLLQSDRGKRAVERWRTITPDPNGYMVKVIRSYLLDFIKGAEKEERAADKASLPFTGYRYTPSSVRALVLKALDADGLVGGGEIEEGSSGSKVRAENDVASTIVDIRSALRRASAPTRKVMHDWHNNDDYGMKKIYGPGTAWGQAVYNGCVELAAILNGDEG